MKTALFWTTTLIFTLLMQIGAQKMMSLWGVFPNILLLAALFSGISRGTVAGSCAGFVFGFLADIFSLSLFGSQTFLYTFMGYCAGHLKGQIDEERPLAQTGIVFVFSLGEVAGLWILETFFGESNKQFYALASWLRPFYTALLGSLYFSLMKLWTSLFA
ncbi:MAG: rod shape-determining protein MreD [Elusimicrobia bacterium]|nr:rod shape-determining protein MreD [Elusimicrobiota bacterium]MBI4217978.1 rod shape-determining protein MreD [Elusimicrobiota bacterium]